MLFLLLKSYNTELTADASTVVEAKFADTVRTNALSVRIGARPVTVTCCILSSAVVRGRYNDHNYNNYYYYNFCHRSNPYI